MSSAHTSIGRRLTLLAIGGSLAISALGSPASAGAVNLRLPGTGALHTNQVRGGASPRDKSSIPVSIGHDAHHDTSRPLRSIKPATPVAGPPNHILFPLKTAGASGQAARGAGHSSISPQIPDGLVPDSDPISPAIGVNPSGAQAPASGAGWDGLNINSVSEIFVGEPPDTQISVGPTQIVEVVNVYLAVYDKTGHVLLGPENTDALWSGFTGGICSQTNNGDGNVLYDTLHNRWIVSQFAVSNVPEAEVTKYAECVAVSNSSDATGTWNRYEFNYNFFPDYPKMGVWPDAYYISFNQFGAQGAGYFGPLICAYDSNAMRSGAAAREQCSGSATGSVNGGAFTGISNSYIALQPASVDGTTPPPAGEPEYFVSQDANKTGLSYWTFHTDWANTANTIINGPIQVPGTTPVTQACGGGAGTCIPQKGTTQALDSLSDRLMYRLEYRNYGDHESMVISHTVDANGGQGAAWYELRSNGAGSLNTYQQGTYAPDSNSRWMGSMAQDKTGDIGFEYSLSGSKLYPQPAYTLRAPSDPLGTLDAERVISTAGAGNQNGHSRWGDYSALAVDPSDDCTFWAANEYLPAGSADFVWRTWIYSFKNPGCGSTNPAPTVTAVSPTSGPSAGGTAVTITGTNFLSGAAVTFGTVAAAVTSVTATSISATTPAEAAATVAVTVTNTDGQSATLPAAYTFTASSNPPPSLTSISPTSGPATGGTAVTLSGANFVSGATVSFGGVNATISTLTAGAISVTTPGHSAGSVSVTVTNPDAQSSTLANAFTYTTTGPQFCTPQFTDNSPNDAPDPTPGSPGGQLDNMDIQAATIGQTSPSGDVDFRIQVNDFERTVPSDGTSSNWYTMWDGPPDATGSATYNFAHAAFDTWASGDGMLYYYGNYDTGTGQLNDNVQVTGGYQQGPNGYVDVFVPVADLTQTTLPNVWPVTYLGQNSPDQAGGQPAPSTGLVTPVDPASGTSDTQGLGFTVGTVCAMAYTLNVASISPSSGPATGGTAVTINGSSFKSGATVTIGGALATGVSFVNSGRLTAITPAGTTGPADVTVTNADGISGTLPGGFTYQPAAPPTITALSPTSGSTAGGTPVTITGTNFQVGAVVDFGATAAASSTVNSATSITATSPAEPAGPEVVKVVNPDGGSASFASFTFVSPTCYPLFTDPSGDALNTAPGGNSQNIESLDVVAGGIGSSGGAQSITARIQVANLDLQVPSNGTSLIWYVEWTYNGTGYFAEADYDTASTKPGLIYEVGHINGSLHQGDFATTGTEYTGANGGFDIDVPLADVGAPPSGASISPVFADTWLGRTVDGAGSISQIDRGPNSGGGDWSIGDECPLPSLVGGGGGGTTPGNFAVSAQNTSAGNSTTVTASGLSGSGTVQFNVARGYTAVGSFNAPVSNGAATATIPGSDLQTSGQYAVTAVYNGQSVTGSFTVSAGPATQLFARAGSSQIAPAGNETIFVTAADQYGNASPSLSSASWDLFPPSGGFHTSGTVKLSAGSGTVSFAGTDTTTPGRYQFDVSAAGLATGQTTFTVSTGAAPAMAGHRIW